MKKKIRTSLAVLALLAAGAAAPLLAAETEELDLIVITGSRIPTIQKEGPSPVTVITAEDIQMRGFTTVLDVTQSLTQITGNAQAESFPGFTQNANALDVRGLGPGRTLILVDGRRMTDYPLPYNSESNFVNLSAIPAAAVERIEMLSGGASAIYGSDAVAGVINIVLKKSTDTPLDVNIRYGDTTQGGGESMRVQGVGGFSSGGFNLLYALELYKRDPIYGFQRKFQDSVQDNPDPDGRINPRALLRTDPFDVNDDGLSYIDPGAAACTPFPNFEYSTRPGFGNYCGQPDDPAQATIRNERKRGSLFTRASYQFDRVELYGTASYFKSDDTADPNFSWWGTSALPEQFVFDVSEDPDGIGGNFALLQRFFQPYEIGGRSQREETFKEEVIDASAGIRGDVGSWRYDLSYSHSQYEVKRAQRLLVAAAVNDYFLGPQVGTDPFFGFYPAHAVDFARFYSPITPAIWNQLTDINNTNADSSNDVATLVLNGDLFKMPAGMVSTAVVLEYGKQDYQIHLDPRLVAEEFWGVTDTGGGGDRSRYALGVEFKVPVVEQVTLKLAGRYDNYDDITLVNDAFTFNAGLEYRPTQKLLLRGSYATSFRAPDMHEVFAGASGFFTTVSDEYLCRRDEPGVSLPACTNGEVNIFGTRQGNPGLEEETSDSYTFGFVVQPNSALTFSMDYYNISLKGAVLDDSIGNLLQTEADCRLGSTEGGTPVDINSSKCQAAIARVTRFPNDGSQFSEALDSVVTGPINTASIKTSGIDAALKWRHPTEGFGTFDVSLAYSHVLKYTQQDFANDVVDNHRDNLQVFDWRSRINGSVTWSFGPFSTTGYVMRNGGIPNWAETGRISSYTSYNWSAQYGFLDGKADVGVFVDNVFNKNPPRDPTYNTYPYYADFNYSPVGREIFVQLRYKF